MTQYRPFFRQISHKQLISEQFVKQLSDARYFTLKRQDNSTFNWLLVKQEAERSKTERPLNCPLAWKTHQ